MKQPVQDQPDTSSGTATATELTAELLRRQTAEACAHLREQAARMRAGLPPDPVSQPPPSHGGEEVGG
ncbi:hypothetical protein GCM10010495_65640 [Kitasatospora herbaricolor]|uniref:hypothetical protein n=1 Tax=Kitasatospora herbaricolor TaxID=68217 RepID=UPI00174A3301|nr:hypothetical protein [Kitasatospora herbaricolor]MDQ0313409.1 hypothetical protein [Kitasatospora herbaricolor]GGV39177.1 hypothetical protein GCM10010495_65640 [Kitasatospora herbaricolor]